MNRIWNFCRDYGLSVVLVLMFFVAIFMLGVREYRSHQFKEASVQHVFLIKLKDGCGIAEATAIQKNLEVATQQEVTNELVDSSRQLYRIRVKCPPDRVHSIWDWLSGRKWIESARPENL